MSRYDPQRRRRLTTRANTTAVEALLDGEPSRPRRRLGGASDPSNPPLVPEGGPHESRISDAEPATMAPEARSGCLTGLLTLGRR